MSRERLEQHLRHPLGRGVVPTGAATASAGGAPCGDVVRLAVLVEAGTVTDAGFDAAGCGATLAAGSAAVALARGRAVLDVARVGVDALAAELGGLSVGKRHAAELAADALHRALGAAVAADGACDPEPGRTLVAMSGGVDSAVAALLVTRAGREAVGVTVELWADPAGDGTRSCCSADAVRAARALAHRMGMAHLTLDLRDAFRAGVVDPYVADHRDGLTPNPCVRCNGAVRLDGMLALADRIGAAELATGHYARVLDDGEGPLLRAALDVRKDQAYMLAALAPASLARLRFPLGELTKPAVRALAAAASLPVAAQPDSQDLCFLAGTDRAAFLARHGGVGGESGEIVDAAGRRLGRHGGHHGFTVGQRRGIGVAAPEPLYVLGTDARANRVVVGPREQLRSERAALRDVTLRRPGARVDRVKLRYRSAALACRLAGAPAAGHHARLEALLDEPAFGVAPGQTACLLDGDVVVGWGTIARPADPARSAAASREPAGVTVD